MFIKCVGFKVNCLRKKVCVPFLATDAVHFKKSANAGKATEKNTSSNDTAWCGSMQNHTAFAICRVVYANWFVTAREGFLVHSQQCYLHQSQPQTHTHTHTRLTALCPGLPRWADTRKAKPIWILLKQETVSGSGISWNICKSAPRSRQITTPAPHHWVFYRPDALPATQPTASKHWRHNQSQPVRYNTQCPCTNNNTQSHYLDCHHCAAAFVIHFVDSAIVTMAYFSLIYQIISREVVHLWFHAHI